MNRKARKEHHCTLCQKTINKDEVYEYQRITPWDHAVNEYFFDYKAHLECDEIWTEYGHIDNWEFPDSWNDFMESVEFLR